ncbi:Type-1 restriction enzyme EcoKI specificity protein [Lactococcus lactis]|uniref:Type I restriction-modification system specificity subunit S n=5 Tax=Bacillati TaxID=1783272 RepID=A0A0V8ENH2_LACLL|nr:restriction endonuclease subunit S [Lactococcus lactis]KSU27049.1 Type I restriction-modification system specificity subunit S [Lactococcus lactis subsp. lactis]MCH5354572.1 restriction endonuclease subunit S [Lactococcus lactis]MDU0407198.1 Type-1 restriction enzyme EcoKI specificity protein [Lactococcus lactis]
MSKKSPQLRFEGFTDDWEERKFSNLAEVRRGLTYKPSDVQKYGIRVLRSSNIAEDTFLIKSDDVFVNKEAVKIDKVKNGDILITSANGSSRLVGKHALIEGIENDTVHGGFMLVARAEKPEFVNAIMSSSWYSKFINIFVSGGNGAIGNLSKSDLEDQKVYVPSEIEQTKIGLFFKGLDDTIALHQRKLDLLKEQKKGYLQKMFSKNGEKVPELRFAGFADDWEQRKLEELGNLNRGKSKHRPRNDSRLFGGEYPFIQTGDVAKAPLFLTEYSQTYSEFGIQQSKLWDIGTLLITIAANIADTTILGIKAAFPDSIIGFESTSCDVVFIKNYIDIQSDLLKRKAETSSQANLNLAKLKEMNLNIPKLKEQQKIGSFFKQLDDTIALHQRKLDLLKEQKKGFLQKMFV